MTEEHRDSKRTIESVRSVNERREYISQCALDKTDIDILTLRYVDFKTFGFIADTIGLSLSQVQRRHKWALRALSDVIKNTR